MFSGLFFLVLLVAVIALLTLYSPKAEKAGNAQGSEAAFLDSFSVSIYKPMLRLATQMDQRFLALNHSESLAQSYRNIQRSLLREYIRDASKDFKRLYGIATVKSVNASSDPGDFSTALFEQQMTFVLLTWCLETRLLFDRVLPFALDLKPLVGNLENLAMQTRELARPRLSYHVV